MCYPYQVRLKFESQSTSCGADGFALVIALSLMAFVLLLVLSISTLVQVEQASSANIVAKMEAEQAALLSLNLAIGKLQELAGLDQRVTASAAALASVNGPQQLTGVWRSWEGDDHDKADGLPIVPDYDSKTEDYDGTSSSGRFLGWLVSSAYDSSNTTSYEAGAESPLSLEEVSDITVPLLSSGSVELGTDLLTGDAETAADVEVHLQPTELFDGEAEVAWWISGENTKALIRGAPEEPTDDSGWSQRLASYGRADPVSFGLVDDDDLDKVNSLKSVDVLSLSDSSLSQDYFHDMTAFSRGLLTNTANGGWRRDLSLMAEQWNEGAGSLPSTGLPVFTTEPYAAALESSLRLSNNPSDAAIYPWVTEDNVAMSWNALLDFVSLYKKVNLNATSGEPYFDLQFTNTSDWITIQPLLARVHIAFGYDATVSGEEYVPRLLIKPSATMWNPYNVAIESSVLTELRLDDSSFPFDLYVTVGDQDEAEVNLGKMLGDNVGSYARYLPQLAASADQTMKPGESRIFGKENISSSTSNWNFFYMDPGFDIDGSLTLPLSQGSSITSGSADDKFSFRWDYKTSDSTDTVSAYFRYSKSRNITGLEGWSWRYNYIKYQMKTSRATAEEKIPLPELKNDSQTLLSAESNDSPFLVVSMGLRTLKNESELGPVLQSKVQTKGFFNNDFFVEQIFDQSGQTSAISGTTFEDSPYDWEIFAPNDWESVYMPQSDPDGAYDIDHTSYIGSSFQAAEGLERFIVAELPTQPLLSLGELQHFNVDFRNISPPHVMNEIGNSHASPHIASDEIINSSISTGSYDHSYVSNHVLFDDWFFSSITPEYQSFTQNEVRSIETVYEEFLSLESPLRNWQYLPANPLSGDAAQEAASEFYSALESGSVVEEMPWYTIASEIEVEGMFNINSTSVEAWKAILLNLSNAQVPYASVGTSAPDDWETALATTSDAPVTRTTVVDDPDTSANSAAVFVSMTEEQVEALAKEIVTQVKLRGPFLSLAEFVNRRLDTDKELAYAGAIESALIALSELGSASENPYATIQADFPRQAVLPSDASDIYEFEEAAVGNHNGDSGYVAYGTPGWPRQADLLRPLAPIISARDDTFLIRAYGSSKDPITGEIQASAWCEAIVQRKADFVDPSNVSTDYTNLSDVNQVFGRRFEIVSFRWLSFDEI
jgi:hypothetical protein